MTEQEIMQLKASLAVPHPAEELALIATHISWVLLGPEHAYKIKKPVSLGFLDFSTPELRKKYCELEVSLNRRLAPQMYLGVLPVRFWEDRHYIGDGPGRIVDYAVHMKRMDESRQLDVLLEKGSLPKAGIISLAGIIARFHLDAPKVPEPESWEELYTEFADILHENHILKTHLGEEAARLMEAAVKWSLGFLKGMQGRIEERNRLGFVIEGHGDLHCRNIFLLDPPVIFDCIEFNQEFRQLDMLNEVAFLCMDLERFGRPDLAELFCEHYFSLLPCMGGKADEQLFLFYKLHRANVRIKVHAIGISELEQEEAIQCEVKRMRGYMGLFREYFSLLRQQP